MNNCSIEYIFKCVNAMKKKCDCENDEFIAGVKGKMPDDDLIIDMSDLFKIFGDGTRLRILLALKEQELCVDGISKTVDMSLSAVSHQLKVLKDANLVKGKRSGKQVYYSLCDEHVLVLLSTAAEHIQEGL